MGIQSIQVRPNPGSTSYVPSAPIVVTNDDVEIAGKYFSAPWSNGPLLPRTFFITTPSATAASPVRRLTLRDCYFKGGTFGLWLNDVWDLRVDRCIFEDMDYAGLGGYSCLGGVVSNSISRRVGLHRTDMSDGAFGNNAYGFTLDRVHTGNLVTDPLSAHFNFDNCLAEDCALWMGFNTHAAVDVTYTNCISRRCARSWFLAGDGDGNESAQLKVDRCRVETPLTMTGGTTDLEGILYASVAGMTVTNNGLDWDAVDPFGGGTIGSPGYFDLGNVSTGEVISGNFLI